MVSPSSITTTTHKHRSMFAVTSVKTRIRTHMIIAMFLLLSSSTLMDISGGYASPIPTSPDLDLAPSSVTTGTITDPRSIPIPIPGPNATTLTTNRDINQCISAPNSPDVVAVSVARNMGIVVGGAGGAGGDDDDDEMTAHSNFERSGHPLRNFHLLRRLFGPPKLEPLPMKSELELLTDETTHVLLGFSYATQVHGNQYIRQEFPLRELFLPDSTLNDKPGGDMILLPKSGMEIKDSKMLYWSCFVVANRRAWVNTKPKMIYVTQDPTTTPGSTPHPTTLTSSFSTQKNIVYTQEQAQGNNEKKRTVMRIPQAFWKTQKENLGITPMCVDSRGDGPGTTTVLVHEDLFAGNMVLSQGAQWQKWKKSIENWPEGLKV
ncbi:uncharacterized protein C8R40DRAFT_1121574 [Lentinula edodes]|uniref:uncharacterized protein n=1 Tax=Lentinula edodes TaxID=5353 RepID=UPI001E8ECB89|nr:uncharacterized protein C8R40DRAFT_1121574 [Lentinula edodes]KAH7871675.1 hypothetical protein C8R40DRAFT_1121574 [Lentinula edodes]